MNRVFTCAIIVGSALVLALPAAARNHGTAPGISVPGATGTDPGPAFGKAEIPAESVTSSPGEANETTAPVTKDGNNPSDNNSTFTGDLEVGGP